MDLPRRRPAALLALLFAASGCGGTFRVAPRGQPPSLSYEAPRAEAVKGPVTLRIGRIDLATPLPEVTIGRYVRRLYLPAIVFNYFAEDWRAELGRAELANDPEAFLRGTLVEELQRGSRLGLVTGPAERELEVTVTRMDAAALVKMELFVVPFPGGGEIHRAAGPVVSTVEAELLLRGGTATPCRQRVAGTAEIEVPWKGSGQVPAAVLVPALARGLSLAIADLNRRIVQAVDGAALDASTPCDASPGPDRSPGS